MKRLEKATTYNKRGLGLKETEDLLRGWIMLKWSFDRIVYAGANKWVMPTGDRRSTGDIWGIMTFYSKPMPF